MYTSATPMNPISFSAPDRNLWEEPIARPKLNSRAPKNVSVDSKMPADMSNPFSDALVSSFFQGFVAGLALGVVLTLSVKA